MLTVHFITKCSHQWKAVPDQQLAVKAASHPSLGCQLQNWNCGRKGGAVTAFPWDSEWCSRAVLFLPFLLCCLPSVLPKGKQMSCVPACPSVVPGCPRLAAKVTAQLWSSSLAVREELPFLSLTYLLGSGLFATSVRDPGVYSINGV